MAEFIHTNGTVASVTPKNGKAFTLQEMQEFVGGYIEALRLDDGRILWLNEDGKRLNLNYNPWADFIAHERGPGIAPNDHVVGNVIITTREEAGEDETGEEG